MNYRTSRIAYQVLLKQLLQMYLRQIVVRFIFYTRENLFTLTTTDYVMWRIQNYVLEFYFVSQTRGFRNKADVLILLLLVQPLWMSLDR